MRQVHGKGAASHLIRNGIALFMTASLCLSGCSRKESDRESSAQPTPTPPLPRRNYDTGRLYSGLALKSSVECTSGTQTTLETIAETNSYQVDISLHVRWPAAATNTAQLATATPELPPILPDLDQLLDGISPSPDYAQLLSNKEKSLRSHLASLQKLPYRDSLFDCQTILNLRNQPSGRRALLVQAIMNVNTDGSDGDRNIAIDRTSSTFQPQTNYRWAKSGHRTNPCLRDAEVRLALAEAELANGTNSPEVRQRLESECTSAKATIAELKHWSFLVGTADPFIVLPSFMVGKSTGQLAIGDFAVVIAHGILYPAVLGDLGPGSKIGEASLRICREVDAKSEAERRPDSRPDIVYLVFPGSADKPLTAPDYKHWSERCHALWKEFGGSDSTPWHEWTSLELPWPTPTPSQTPSATPTHADPPNGTNSASIPSNSTSILSSPPTNR